MKTDMITLFNRLTTSELADYNLFSNMIDLHYEKFKYLYYMLKDVDLSGIDTITCDENEDRISVKITVLSDEYMSDIIHNIYELRDSYKKSNYFTTDINHYSNTININISMSGREKERELYADRLI